MLSPATSPRRLAAAAALCTLTLAISAASCDAAHAHTAKLELPRLPLRGVRTAAKAVVRAASTTSRTVSHKLSDLVATPQGMIEGTVVNDAGKPVNADFGTLGTTVVGWRVGGGGGFRARTDAALGGSYSAERLRPGVYVVTVPAGEVDGVAYAPQRIGGVVIDGATPTRFDLVLAPGARMRESSLPSSASQPGSRPAIRPAVNADSTGDADESAAPALRDVNSTWHAPVVAATDDGSDHPFAAIQPLVRHRRAKRRASKANAAPQAVRQTARPARTGATPPSGSAAE